jgi:membrane protein
MPDHYVLPPVVWVIVGFCVSFGVEVALFALIFKLLPRAQCPWRLIWAGSVGTALFFEVGKWALGWYLGRESTVSLYGAAGSLVLLLLWVYYSAMIILTGAVMTHAYCRLHPDPKTI